MIVFPLRTDRTQLVKGVISNQIFGQFLPVGNLYLAITVTVKTSQQFFTQEKFVNHEIKFRVLMDLVFVGGVQLVKTLS